VASLLQQINSPTDLKRLTREDLTALAAEVRTFLLETLAETGGHLGSNFGVVELTLALHYAFDSPTDAFVWDVSHQSYTHKLLTGRREHFPTLRQLDGLGGFARRTESPHDVFDAGHGGTSISAALGIARARAITGKPGRAIAIIGDGALTNGMALEALNDAGHSGANLLVVLNDNAMAISQNVGAIARYLSRARSDPHYLTAKARFDTLMRRLPGGLTVVEMVERLKAAVKQVFIPGMLFEDLGLTYLGPVDGHSIPALLESLARAKRVEGPVLLHVFTTKGKGYQPAEVHNTRLHGISAFNIESGEPLEDTTEESYSYLFGEALCRLAEADKRVVAITAAMCDGTGLTRFRERFPSRFFDVGMAEEHAVTLAAGMAAEGLRPVVAIYSTFLQRAYDQVMHDVCMQGLPVTFALDRAGLVGEDGPTHHGTFDLSYLSTMPGMTIMAPSSVDEMASMLGTAIRSDSPCAIRYPRGRATKVSAWPVDAESDAHIAAGKAAIVRQGRDVALIAIGAMLPIAVQAAQLLATRGVEATVVDARFAKPLDTATLLAAAEATVGVITLEENALAGGFGSAVRTLLAPACPARPVLTLGIPDQFVGQGPRNILLQRLGLSPVAVADTAFALVRPVGPGCGESETPAVTEQTRGQR
jgi:1-deoxy-D-xylulose-5-phosphate synthase